MSEKELRDKIKEEVYRERLRMGTQVKNRGLLLLDELHYKSECPIYKELEEKGL